jgi:hypothetical protein
MKYSFAFLLSVASVFAQDPAAVTSAMGAASITDMAAPMATGSLASLQAQASCLTGAYVPSGPDHRYPSLTFPAAPTRAARPG